MQDELINKASEIYAGMWVEYEPEFRIVVAFTQAGEKTIQTFLTEDIASVIDVITVNNSLNYLLDIQSQFNSSLKSQNISSDSWVDVKKNCVVFNISKYDYLIYNDMVKNAKLSVPHGIQVNSVESLSQLETDIYGGLNLYNTWLTKEWTSGFGVKTSSGTKGIATCAHAPNDAVWWHVTPHFLTFQSELYQTSYDVQWHTCPGLTVTNKIKWYQDGSTLSITATRSRTSLFVGEAVYKYGRTTHYTGGTVNSIYAIIGVPNCAATFIQIYNEYEYDDLSAGGDSGCPWFYGGTAYGIHTAGDDANQYAYFMSVTYVSGLGVSIMTSP